MRKFLMVVAVGALALLVAAPASALDFKFGGEYRVRLYDGVNVGFSKAAGTNPRGVQLRVRPIFDVSDDNGNIQARLRLEVGDIEFGNNGGAGGQTNGQTPAQGPQRVGPGAGGAIGNDGVNVETKSAYMDFAMPWGLPARVRAGIMPWYLPKGLIVDDDIAGIRIYGSMKPVSYQLAWYRAAGGSTPTVSTGVLTGVSGTSVTSSATFCNFTAAGGILFNIPSATFASAAACTAGGGTVVTPLTGAATVVAPTGTAVALTSIAAGTSNTIDNNYDFYEFKLDFALLPWLNPGVYYVFGDNRVNIGVANRARDNHWVGLTSTGKIGTVSYDLDWIYGISEGGTTGTFGGAATPITVKGWAADGAVHFPLGPLTINLAASYATGDSQNGGDSEAFPTFASSWNGAGNNFELIGSGGAFDAVEFTQDMPTNLWMLGFWIDYKPVAALATKLTYAYAGFAKKSGNCTAANVPAGSACFGPAYAGSATDSMVGKSSLGHEISLRADYTVWTGFKLQGQLGWLFPSAGEVAHEYVFQMLYNF